MTAPPRPAGSRGFDLVVAGRSRGQTVPSGRFRPPSDKSISLRALLLGALADGESTIDGVLVADDVTAMRGALQRLGVRIETRPDGMYATRVVGGRDALAGPPVAIDAVESGTTARLLLGVLASVDRVVRLDGRGSLRRRPMDRVVAPLALMGAVFDPPDAAALPLAIRGRARLAPLRLDLDVPSAQVKSAILLAGLAAEGETSVTERSPSRDHIERMLPAFGARVARSGGERGAQRVSVAGPQRLTAARLRVPGDVSSALYAGLLGLATDGARIAATDVGVNPTRCGALAVLRRMGAAIAETPHREAGGSSESGEPVADVVFAGSELRGVDVEPEAFASLLDDVPVLCAAGALARDGVTTIRGAAELRVKESDRIESLAAMLRAFGAEVETGAASIAVRGGCALQGATVDAAGDHRIALAGAVLALAIPGESRVRGFGSAAKSYPGLLDDLAALGIERERLRIVPAR